MTSFERDPSHPGRLTLTLGRGVTGGTAEVFWLLERPAVPDSGEIRMPEIGLPDFLRGETTVAVISPRPLVLDETKGRREGYERIDESDLPAELKEMADSTVLLALRRIGAAPPALAIQVSSFPDATGLAGVIDRAKVLTIAARDGSRIDRWQIELQTRESFVRFPLPANATLWSLQIDGKPSRPLMEAGRLVIPLGRGEKSARARWIEIVLAIPAGLSVSGKGTARIEMPKLPFPTTHAEWDLLLPETSLYRYAGGTLLPAPARPLASGTAGGIGPSSGSNTFNLDEISVQGSGRLSGRVVDAYGKALPGVTVTIGRREGGYRQSASTNADGSFFFTGVPAGTFQIQGALSGFNSVERDVSLSDGGNLGADLKMALLSASEAITVTAEAPMIDALKTNTSMTFINNSAGVVPRQSSGRKDAAKEGKEENRRILTDDERASLQRTAEAGVAAIQVELPTEGKGLHFEGDLLVDAAAVIDLQFKPVRRGLFR